jgi:serine/threonine-protein kinase
MNTPQHTPPRLGRYRIDDLLGHGPLGSVYRSFDPQGQRMVAIKALRPGISGGPIGRRLLEQARNVARLAHPGIVAVHEVDTSASPHFIVMEYVAGLNLAQWLAGTPLPPQSAILQLMDQLLEALEFAHRAGVRHGGIKPTNVLIAANGLVKIGDFGIARLEDGTLLPGAQPSMLAPEVALGRPIDNGVDIYAAGALLYRLLTGREPAVDDAASGGRIGAARAPSSFAEARRPAAFDAIVARAMARLPGGRYPTAEAFREALGAAFGQMRPLHGAGSVELAKLVTAPAAAAPRAVPPRVAAFAAQVAKAFNSTSGEPAPELKPAAPPAVKPAAADKPQPAMPVLTIAIPDDVLSMPAFDPWADSGHQAETPLRDQRAGAPAASSGDEDEDEDEDTVSGILPMDEEAYRAFIDQIERERREQAAAAAQLAPAARPAQPARPGPGPAAPGAAAAPSAVPQPGVAEIVDSQAIPIEALRRTLKIMTPHFGAAAGPVLKQVVGQARTIAELHEMILERAGETVDRRKMRKQLKAIAKLPL